MEIPALHMAKQGFFCARVCPFRSSRRSGGARSLVMVRWTGNYKAMQCFGAVASKITAHDFFLSREQGRSVGLVGVAGERRCTRFAGRGDADIFPARKKIVFFHRIIFTFAPANGSRISGLKGNAVKVGDSSRCCKP